MVCVNEKILFWVDECIIHFHLPIWGEQTWPSDWRSDIFMSYEQSGMHCGNKLAARQHVVMLYDGVDGSTSI